MKFDHASHTRGGVLSRLGRSRRRKVKTFALLGASLAFSAMTAAATLGSGGAASATVRPHAASPIVICEVSAQSGAALGVGIGDLDGVQAYVKWINAHGGVLGRKYLTDASR